jgi:histidine triad (HIT) family protein
MENVAPSIFTQIIDGKIPGKIAYQDDQCAVLHDIRPQAPTHLLIVPKKQITRIGEAAAEDEALLGHLLLIAGKMATELGLINGFRLIINNGQQAGETVPHLHIHLLGGRPMQWPPG